MADFLDDPESSDGTVYEGRRRRAIELENRPTRVLSDHVAVHEILASSQKMALARTDQDLLQIAVRAAHEHTHSLWAAVWISESGGAACAGIDAIPQVMRDTLNKYQQTCVLDEGQFADAPLLVTPLLLGDHALGGIGVQLEENRATEDEILTLEFLAALCVVGYEHGQMLDDEETKLRKEEQARRRAERSEEHKTDYLNMISHDVRGPLTVINGYAQMLSSMRESMSADKQDQMLKKISDQSVRIERLVSDILDVARSEAGQLELNLEPLDANIVIEHALSLGDTEGLFELTLAPQPVMAHMDGLRIEQIVINIVSNALKYGAAPYCLHVVDDGDHWRMAIGDGGEGIPPETEENLFQRFMPGAKTIGLGLWIVKTFVDAHQGQILYRRGEVGTHFASTFHIRLPKRPPT